MSKGYYDSSGYYTYYTTAREFAIATKKLFTINNKTGEYFNQNLYPLCNKFERLLRQVLFIRFLLQKVRLLISYSFV